jgi:hypothetical protein
MLQKDSSDEAGNINFGIKRVAYMAAGNQTTLSKHRHACEFGFNI